MKGEQEIRAGWGSLRGNWRGQGSCRSEKEKGDEEGAGDKREQEIRAG